MATKTTMVPALMGTGSHWVEVNGYRNGGEKEEIFFYLNASWRGQPVRVTMTANRYVYDAALASL